MKTLIVLIFLGFLGYTVFFNMSGANLAKTYCKKLAQEETTRRFDAGLRVRDRETESDNFDVCMEELEDASLGKVALKYLQPRDKAEGILE